MKKAQVTFDFLIAVMLVTVTVAGAVSIASGESASVRTLDAATKTKIFAVDLRDTVIKAYSIGEGFTIVKRAPFDLSGGDSVEITLDSGTSKISVKATIGGKTFKVEQVSPVPLCDSQIELKEGNVNFNVTVVENGGQSCVIVEK